MARGIEVLVPVPIDPEDLLLPLDIQWDAVEILSLIVLDRLDEIVRGAVVLATDANTPRKTHVGVACW